MLFIYANANDSWRAITSVYELERGSGGQPKSKDNG